MKKYIILLLIIIMPFSCKSIPEPENESDSLIIGSVVWDFPDGLFQLEPRTLRNNITIAFVNLTTSEQFKVNTSDGYFNFICNGNDKFMLQYVMYQDPSPAKSYTVSYPLNLRIDSKPRKIIYVGHILITFASPGISEAKEGDAMITTSWRFRENYVIENKIEDAKAYVADNDGNNVWRDYTILNLYEK
ncbi:MAG: hypothetical protein JW822_13325 [Spirochaetales bacterium]|nr:hypothetical protein [Spirochaetales bacterium]